MGSSSANIYSKSLSLHTCLMTYDIIQLFLWDFMYFEYVPTELNTIECKTRVHAIKSWSKVPLFYDFFIYFQNRSIN